MKQLIILYIQKCQPLTLDKNCIFSGLHELPAEVDDGLEHRQRPGFNLKKNFAEVQEN
jgi:hypothetical protein